MQLLIILLLLIHSEMSPEDWKCYRSLARFERGELEKLELGEGEGESRRKTIRALFVLCFKATIREIAISILFDT